MRILPLVLVAALLPLACNQPKKDLAPQTTDVQAPPAAPAENLQPMEPPPPAPAAIKPMTAVPMSAAPADVAPKPAAKKAGAKKSSAANLPPTPPMGAEPAAAKAGAGQSYVVQKQDTLWSISKQFLGNGNRWQEITAINPGLTAQNLKVGQTIQIPASR